MVENDDLEGFPEHIKNILRELPKGKKSDWDAERDKKEILEDIKRNVEDNSFIAFDLDNKLFSVSYTYGNYYTKEWCLYFYRNKIDMDDYAFQDLFNKVTEFLYNMPVIIRTNKIISQNSLKEFEILFLAFKKEYVIDVISGTDFPLSNTLNILNAICQDVAYKIYKFLQNNGFSSSYPHIIKETEFNDVKTLEKEFSEQQNRQFIIELRSAQKLLIMTTLLKDIKNKCESPIEFDLGLKLAEDNIPFIQQQEITENGCIIAKPDFLIQDPFKPIAIFCDGHEYHEKTFEQATRDKRIDRKLQQMNFIVLRFTGIEIRNNIERCVEEIKGHYLGKEFAKTPTYIIFKKLVRINPKILNDWEYTFYQSIWDYVRQKKPLTIKQERIIKRLLDKTEESIKTNKSEC